MADFKYFGTLGGGSPETKTVVVAAGAVGSIPAGKIVIVDNGAALQVANGGANADGRFGLSVSDSTDTVAAAGTVQVQFCPTGLLVVGAATTPGNLAAAILYNRVTLDEAAGVQTVDENDPNGVLTIYPCDNDTNFFNDTQVVVSVPWQV